MQLAVQYSDVQKAVQYSTDFLKGGTDRAVQSADYKEIFSAVIDTYHNNAVLRRVGRKLEKPVWN